MPIQTTFVGVVDDELPPFVTRDVLRTYPKNSKRRLNPFFLPKQHLAVVRLIIALAKFRGFDRYTSSVAAGLFKEVRAHSETLDDEIKAGCRAIVTKSARVRVLWGLLEKFWDKIVLRDARRILAKVAPFFLDENARQANESNLRLRLPVPAWGCIIYQSVLSIKFDRIEYSMGEVAELLNNYFERSVYRPHFCRIVESFRFDGTLWADLYIRHSIHLAGMCNLLSAVPWIVQVFVKPLPAYGRMMCSVQSSKLTAV